VPLIDPLSTTSLYLKLNVNGLLLSTATGFVVEHRQRYFLVTNWHVLSGRHPDTDAPLSKTAALPDEVRIAHHLKNQLGTWRFHGERLNNPDGSPRWISHPLGRAVDVAVLELQNLQPDTQIYPFPLVSANVDIAPQPATPVSVIGFPLGLRANAFFPIWKTGHIATDPDLDYEGKPAFLIDATTREGMSGSPVVLRTSGPYLTSTGNTVLGGGVLTKFLGVYASRIHDDAEIGCVWRPKVILDILNQIQ
jgi:hypothetical protein